MSKTEIIHPKRKTISTCSHKPQGVFERNLTLPLDKSSLTSTDEERPNLINSLKSTLKATAIALAIVLVSGYCINILFDALIRTVLTFIPLFLMDAIGYLSLGILLRAVVRVCEKMNVRSDATNKARKIIEFAMSGLVPLAIYTFVTEVTTEAIYLILSCGIASWGYRKINEVRAAKASAAA